MRSMRTAPEGYVSVDDDMVEAVYEIFKERNTDKFDFDD